MRNTIRFRRLLVLSVLLVAIAAAQRASAMSAQSAAGDWQWQLGGPMTELLRLRVNATGALIGTLDLPFPKAQRVQLSNVQVSGDTLSYEMPNGATFHGTLSGDGNTIVGTASGSATVYQWKRLRNASQALAVDAAEKPGVTDGVWSGTGSGFSTMPGFQGRKVTHELEFHFGSHPTACSLEFDHMAGQSIMLCQLKLTGNAVQIGIIGVGILNGTLSADRNRMTGMFTDLTESMHVDLVRTQAEK